MAEIQLSIPYKNVVTRQGQLLAWALWPVWAILAPLCIVFTLAAVAAYPAIFPPLITALLIGVSAMAIVFGALWAALAQDDRIHVSKEGMFFPGVLMPRLRFTRYQPWDRLVAADILDESADGPKKLRLVLKGMKAIDVGLVDVPNEELEQLLLAVELWGDKCERAPTLVAYQHEIQNVTKGLERVSYTQMWEEELSRRFTTTAFIPLEPGAQIGPRFKVVRQLSFGGFSAIYLVQDELGQFLVAKESVIPASVSDKQRVKAEEHFAREARLLTQINHERIAQVYDHFSEKNRNYIFLEYVEGQNLRQYVNQNGPITNEDCIRWALELADVIDFLHSQSPPIVHRDLSPDNIMLRPDLHLTLIDFGAANQLVTDATGTLVGKQAYMPPEQLRGKATKESDYYSFGGTLHFLLTGQDPIPLAESRPRQINHNVSEPIDKLTAQLTSFEAVERAPGSSSLKAAIQRALEPAAGAIK